MAEESLALVVMNTGLVKILEAQLQVLVRSTADNDSGNGVEVVETEHHLLSCRSIHPTGETVDNSQ